jgi:hypothetical protein
MKTVVWCCSKACGFSGFLLSLYTAESLAPSYCIQVFTQSAYYYPLLPARMLLALKPEPGHNFAPGTNLDTQDNLITNLLRSMPF